MPCSLQGKLLPFVIYCKLFNFLQKLIKQHANQHWDVLALIGQTAQSVMWSSIWTHLPSGLVCRLPRPSSAGLVELHPAALASCRPLMSSCLGVTMSNSVPVELTGVVGTFLRALHFLTPTEDLPDSVTLAFKLGLMTGPVCWQVIQLSSWTSGKRCAWQALTSPFIELYSLTGLPLVTSNSWSALALSVLWLLLVSISWRLTLPTLLTS